MVSLWSYLSGSTKKKHWKNTTKLSTLTSAGGISVAMDDFDLISEPSTAQAVLGARPRLRDPRAVEVDDFDFWS